MEWQMRQYPRSVALKDRKIWWFYCESLTCRRPIGGKSRGISSGVHSFDHCLRPPSQSTCKASVRQGIGQRPHILMLYLWTLPETKMWPHRPTRPALTIVQRCWSHGRYLKQPCFLPLISVPSLHYQRLWTLKPWRVFKHLSLHP